MRSAQLPISSTWIRRLPSAGLALAIAWGARFGFAQDEAPAEGDSDTAAAPAPTVTQAPSTTTVSTSAYGATFMPAPGTNLEAHLTSSSHAKSDIDEPDTFDLRRPAQGPTTLRGDSDALGTLRVDPSTAAGGEAGKAFQIVRKGDTLWSICGEQLGEARSWPRVWALNPQLQNPHWIYPGDQLRLRASLGAPGESIGIGPAGAAFRGGTLGAGNINRGALVPPETVFLRELGYIDDPEQDVWGQVVGAREEQQLLGDGNRVYMILRPGAQVELGQLMTVFEDVRDPPTPDGARRPPGKIVAFKGTVKIDAWDATNRMARGELVESLDVIERGAKVGPIGRRYYVVPPTQSQVDVRARILTSLYPNGLLGGEQVVFIDRGSNDGLVPGNRLFVVRHGDTWRKTLESSSEMARNRILLDVPERLQIAVTPLDGDDDMFPEEVVAELRVIRSHKYASLALITQSHQEIEPGDEAVARKGF